MSSDESTFFLRFDRQKLYFPIPSGTTTIGRLARCGIVLGKDGKRVSRDHAEIRRMGSQLQVRDLGSRNGTLINGVDIRGQGDVPISLGDRLRICDFEGVVTDKRTPFHDSGICNVDNDEMHLNGEGQTALSNLQSTADPSSSDKQHANDRLAALVSIGKSLSNALQTDALLETAVESILDIFPSADRCVIGFASDQALFIPKWWTLRSDNQHSEIRVSQRIFRQVVKTGDSVLFQDAASYFHGSGSVLAGQLRSVMCSPLVDTAGKVIGMIQADAHTSGKFKQSDLEIFATVATQISLAINFSQLHHKAIEDAVFRKDAEQARAVQLQFLPNSSPVVPGYEFADYYSAARHVGGDYYDYIPLADGRLAIVLGDVVGKGVPAALTMVKLATETRAAFEITCDPAEAMTRLNRRLAGSFITCVMLVLDPLHHHLTIVTAGHEIPLLKSDDGQVHRIGHERSGFPLSVVEDFEYEAERVSIAPGDSVIVYSDGFADAENAAAVARFGKERIIDSLSKHRGSATKFVRDLVERVDLFTGGSPQFDDMCMVCFHRPPAE